MKFKNYELESLAKFVYELELSGKKSRMRSRFIRTIEEHVKNVFQKERMSIIEQYALRNEKGEIVLNENKNENKTEVTVLPDKREQCLSEIDELANEYFIIEETETNRDMIVTVADALLNCNAILAGQEAVLYDYWCEEFEGAIDRYGSKEELKK